jgi:phospholipase C
VVSPHTKPGHISHTYTDHASILKFIEANLETGSGDGSQPGQFPESRNQQEQPVRSVE